MKNSIFFFIILICILSSCTEVKENSDVHINSEFPDIIQTNYIHYIYKSARKYLITRIDKAYFYEKKKEINCDEIEAEIFDADGNVTTVIFSDKAFIDQSSKKVSFIGNVIFQLKENDTNLYSDKIILDYENNILFSEKDILIEKEDGSYIKASSMESDIKSEITKFTDMVLKYYYDSEEVNDEKNE